MRGFATPLHRLAAWLRRIEYASGGRLMPVQTCLLGLNVLVFLATVFLGFTPVELIDLLAVDRTALAEGQLWRLLTAAFTHGGPLHIFFNMLGFFFFGAAVERFFGTRGFLGLVLAIAMLGNLVHCLCFTKPVLGFSGVTLGVIVAFGTIAPHQTIHLLLAFVLPVPIKAWLLCTIIVLIDAVYLLMDLSGYYPSGTAHLVHLAGAALGFAAVRWRPVWIRLRNRLVRGRAARRERRADDEHLELDRLLEKVSRHGLPSLTYRERNFLERYSQRQRRDRR